MNEWINQHIRRHSADDGEIVYEGVLLLPGTEDYMLADARLKVQSGEIDFLEYRDLAEDAIFGEHEEDLAAGETTGISKLHRRYFQSLLVGAAVVEGGGAVMHNDALRMLGVFPAISAAVIGGVAIAKSFRRKPETETTEEPDPVRAELQQRKLELHASETKMSLPVMYSLYGE